MSWSKTLMCANSLLLVLGLGAPVLAQEASLPEAPFKTVHLMVVAPDQEAALLAAVQDVNGGIVQAGCASCAYRLFKLYVGKDQRYNYMMTGDWPDRSVYMKVHTSNFYSSASARNPILGDLTKTEFYGRYVEVK